MSYKITKFNNVDLPLYNQEQDIGAGQAAVFAMPLPGGGTYDPLGFDQAPLMASPFSIRGVLTATSAAALRSSYDKLMGLLGLRGPLVREPDDYNGTTVQTQYCQARLQEIKCTRTPEIDYALAVDMSFVIMSPYWYGTVRDTYTSGGSVVLTNGGNYPVSEVLVVASGSFSSLHISISGKCDLLWQGTPAGPLAIDCGKMSVKINGQDAYSGFQLTSNHKINNWLSLRSGNTTVTVTVSGSASVEFNYADGWV
jgi:hypothetical protein